jgi:hypothetical protein
MNNDYAITFFYYDDIHSVTDFYERIMRFELVLDQGLARIYRVAANNYFGIVDGNRGHLRHQEKSAVLFTIVSEDVAAWHFRLSAHNVRDLTEIRTGRFCDHFFFKDPAGYALEIQRFRDPAVARLFVHPETP